MKRLLLIFAAAAVLAAGSSCESRSASPENPANSLEGKGWLDIPVVGAGCYRGVQFTSLDDGILAGEDSRSVSVRPGKEKVIGYSDTLHVNIPLKPAQYASWEAAFDLKDRSAAIFHREEPFRIRKGDTTMVAPLRLSSTESLLEFSFCADLNPNLTSDVAFSIDHETDRVHGEISYYAGLKSMTASFVLSPGAKAYVDGELQTSGKDAHNFYHPVTYEVVDEKGFSKKYVVDVEHFTGIPVLIIDTPDHVAITSRDEWLEGTHIYLDGVGKFEDYEGFSDNVKGRGNATWKNFPKKPYNIKLDDKHEMLGMPANKRWSLIANYRDRTRILNKTAFHIADMMDGMAWASHSEWVSLILNGEQQGLYMFTEQVRVGKHRVDVDELEPDENGIYPDLSPETISGGYLLQIDTYFDEPFKFRTKISDMPVELKSPNDNVPPQIMDYIEGYFNTVEDLLASGKYSEAYKYIDIDSFVDFWLTAAVCGCGDSGRPGSDYMYKKRGGLLYAGPVWDYDGSFNDKSVRLSNVIWYPYLLKDRTFCLRLKEHWDKYQSWLVDIPDYMDSQADLIRKAESYDADIWVPHVGIANYHGNEYLLWPAALERAKQFYREQAVRVNDLIDGFLSATATQ